MPEESTRPLNPRKAGKLSVGVGFHVAAMMEIFFFKCNVILNLFFILSCCTQFTFPYLTVLMSCLDKSPSRDRCSKLASAINTIILAYISNGQINHK